MPVHHTDAERLWRRRRKLEARAAAAKRRAARQAERAAPLWAEVGRSAARSCAHVVGRSRRLQPTSTPAAA
jgi:hypothetical protein